MNGIKFDKAKEKPLLIIFTIIIFLIYIKNVKDFGIFSILDDEFGYWGNAAYFAGLNWSDTVSKIPYYSYGYSILLTPLFFIFNNPISMYKAAIIFNGILSTISFLLCYDITKKITKNINNHILLIISLMISMYPSYIAFINIAWSESLLIFCFWTLTWCFIDLNEKSSYLKFILIGFFSIYIYIIHQRAIGVLIASIFVLVFMKALNKINIRQILSSILIMVLLMILHRYIKINIQNINWMNESGNLVNDYSAQIYKLYLLFKNNNLSNLFRIFIGQFYYLGASTYLLYYIGFIDIIINTIKSFITAIKNNNIYLVNLDNKFYLYVFLSISTILTMIISVIALSNPTRIDQIVYGRYNETTSVVIALIGLLKLLNSSDRLSNKTNIKIILFFIFLTFITNKILFYYNLLDFSIIHAVSLINNPVPSNNYNIYLSTFLSIIIYLLIYTSFKKINTKTQITIIFITIIFFLIGDKVSSIAKNENQEKLKLIRASEAIEFSDINIPIYFLIDGQINPEYDEWNNRSIHDRHIFEYYQFLLKDKNIKLITYEDLIKNKEDKFIISGEIINLFDMLEDYKFCASAYDSYLLVSKGNNFSNKIVDKYPYNDIHIPLEKFYINNNINNECIIKSVDSEGLAMQGPMKKIKKGEYEFIINFDLIDSLTEKIGYVDIYSYKNDEIISKKLINITDFNKHNNNLLIVPFNNVSEFNYIDLKLYINVGSKLRINNISLKRVN